MTGSIFLPQGSEPAEWIQCWHSSVSLHFQIRDLIDIALVAFIIYRFLLLMRGTRGVQMTFGIVMLLLFYWVTRFCRLTAVQWLLSNVLTYMVFAIIVLYQNEIRRGLAGMGKTRLGPPTPARQRWV